MQNPSIQYHSCPAMAPSSVQTSSPSQQQRGQQEQQHQHQYYTMSRDTLRALHQQLKYQIDFYFSKENLTHDTYLQAILNSRDHYGAVPVASICSFPKVKEIYASYSAGCYVHASNATTANPIVVGAAMQNSTVVQVSDDGHWLIPKQFPWSQNTTGGGGNGKAGDCSAATTPTATPTSFDFRQSPAFSIQSTQQRNTSPTMQQQQQQQREHPIAFSDTMHHNHGMVYSMPLPQSVVILPKHHVHGSLSHTQLQHQHQSPVQQGFVVAPYDYPQVYAQGMSGSTGAENSFGISNANVSYQSPPKSVMQASTSPSSNKTFGVKYGPPLVATFAPPNVHAVPFQPRAQLQPHHDPLFAPHANHNMHSCSGSVQNNENPVYDIATAPNQGQFFPAYVDMSYPDNVSFYDGASLTNEQVYYQQKQPPLPQQQQQQQQQQHQSRSHQHSDKRKKVAKHKQVSGYHNQQQQQHFQGSGHNQPNNDTRHNYHGSGTTFDHSFSSSHNAWEYNYYYDGSGGNLNQSFSSIIQGGDSQSQSASQRGRDYQSQSIGTGRRGQKNQSRRNSDRYSQNSGSHGHAGSQKSRTSNQSKNHRKKAVLHDSSNGSALQQASQHTIPVVVPVTKKKESIDTALPAPLAAAPPLDAKVNEVNGTPAFAEITGNDVQHPAPAKESCSSTSEKGTPEAKEGGVLALGTEAVSATQSTSVGGVVDAFDDSSRSLPRAPDETKTTDGAQSRNMGKNVTAHAEKDCLGQGDESFLANDAAASSVAASAVPVARSSPSFNRRRIKASEKKFSMEEAGCDESAVFASAAMEAPKEATSDITEERGSQVSSNHCNLQKQEGFSRPYESSSPVEHREESAIKPNHLHRAFRTKANKKPKHKVAADAFVIADSAFLQAAELSHVPKHKGRRRSGYNKPTWQARENLKGDSQQPLLWPFPSGDGSDAANTNQGPTNVRLHGSSAKGSPKNKKGRSPSKPDQEKDIGGDESHNSLILEKLGNQTARLRL